MGPISPAWKTDDAEGLRRSSTRTPGSLEELGFRLLPARTYLVRVDRSVQSADGQTLGYTWLGRLENWHRRAFSSFGAGNVVWERDGGPLLPFYARNLRSLTEWRVPLAPDQVLPTLQSLQKQGFAGSPSAAGTSRVLQPKPDETQSYGMDLKPLLGAGGTGLVWAALQDGEAIPRAYRDEAQSPRARSSLIQVKHALRSLEYNLSQIQADGSLPPGPRVPGIGTEGRITAAAYVHEGWMAADVYLEEPAVRERLRSALRPHVDWLLGEQLPDGRWDGGATGEFARTPAIVDFLVWYDARCESRLEVRDDVRRAGLLLVDPEKWEATGLFRAGSHHEVQRALSGRSLIALARQRFVL